jgi:hypothetical protein
MWATFRVGLVLFASATVLLGQELNKRKPKMQSLPIKGGTVCHASTVNHFFDVPPPEAYLKWKTNSNKRPKNATIEVTYTGFTPEAEAAFQTAVDIWESLISSPVTIRIQAQWTPLSSGVLGSAGTTRIIRNFSGAQKLNVWYPVALAEKMLGENINDTDPDIVASFNSSFGNWHFSATSPPGAGKYDFITVVLHEIGHGLGIYDGFTVSNGQGSIDTWGTELPIIYDVPIETVTNQNLIQSFLSPSTDLATHLTSGGLFFDSHPIRPQLYAPAVYNSGSSIAHLNDNTYDGTADALMTSAVAPAERIHDPGVALSMLQNMGWKVINVQHTPLEGTESISGPYVVNATIFSDDGANIAAGAVKLNYTLDGVSFTSLDMSHVSGNEYTASIPSSGVARDYGYYISSIDDLGRAFVNPGKIVSNGEPEEQIFYVFSTGPDTESPEIAHTPKPFLSSLETQLELVAIVTDALGVEEVNLEYFINDVAQTPIALPGNSDSDEYKFSFSLPVLQSDDELKYRIVARDKAEIGTPGGNLGYSPSATEYHIVPVVGLKPTQDSYSNSFDSPTDDFFGTGFSITTPAGFANGAIHSTHPYPEGNGLVNNEIELIWQLKVPVRVKAEDATIRFDEIVLVEPGETGSVFGSNEFYDFVVVEGSKDGGLTWTPVADGYDSRSNAAWLTTYNSAITGNNSTATGTTALYKPRSLNLLSKFQQGDEVVIRFRLYSDQLAVGWGWSVDNLRIQIDETLPAILHNHVNYALAGIEIIPLTFQTTDASGLEEVNMDVRVNGGTIQTQNFDVTENNNQYGIDLEVSTIPVGNKIEYRIRAKDIAGNEAVLPTDGFFQVPIISFGTPVTQYVTDFNSANTDFVGNFFSIAQPSGFTNSAVHTPHPYPNGFGLTDNTSDYVLTLTKPVTVAATNAYILFNEIALVEYSGANTKDFIVVEGSKDEGETWHALTNPYAANSKSEWKNVFDTGGNVTTNLFRNRLIDITASGDFEAGDNVLFRFRISADATGNGWGWAMDNLSIQGPVTGVKEALDLFVSVYPNPVKDDVFTLEVKGLSAHNGQLQITNLQGQSLINESINLTGSATRKEFSTSTWADGIYVVRLSLEDGSSVTKKLIKASH